MFIDEISMANLAPRERGVEIRIIFQVRASLLRLKLTSKIREGEQMNSQCQSDDPSRRFSGLTLPGSGGERQKGLKRVNAKNVNERITIKFQRR